MAKECIVTGVNLMGSSQVEQELLIAPEHLCLFLFLAIVLSVLL
jgi:hypothetical protein